MSSRGPATAGMPAVISFSELDGVRYLHFGSRWVQGAMRIAKPDRLELAYVRDMMAWLLFLDPPARILQLGLGAAALTRFCHRTMRSTDIDVVEIDPQVARVARQWFGMPAPDDRLKLHFGDAGRFVSRPRARGRYGVVQVDLYDQDAAGPVIDSEAFYRDCHAALAEPGIMAVNLFGRHASFERSASRIRAAFGQTATLVPRQEGNLVVLAFKGPPIRVSRAQLLLRAAHLRARYGLPAGGWARTLTVQR